MTRVTSPTRHVRQQDAATVLKKSQKRKLGAAMSKLKQAQAVQSSAKVQRDALDDPSANVMLLFEELRQKATPLERKQHLIDQVLAQLEPKLGLYARRHDISRVVEIALKHGSSEQRSRIWNALEPSLQRLPETRYGRHVVQALFQYATGEQRRALIAALRETLVRLAMTQDGADWVDHVYQTIANGRERTSMLMHMLLERDRGLHQLLVGSRDQEVRSGDNALDQLLGFVEEPFHQRLVACCRRQVEQILDKPRALSNALVHDLIWTMLSSWRVSLSEKQELGQELATRALYLYHTNNGSLALMQMVQLGDAKLRKECAKSFREVLSEVWTNKYGHRVILTLLAWTDDTVMLSKTLIRPMIPYFDALFAAAQNSGTPALIYAHVALLFLLAGETTRYFHPVFYRMVWNPYRSDQEVHRPKKDPQTRREEMLAVIAPALFQLVHTYGLSLLCDYRNSPRMGALCIEVCKHWQQHGETERIREWFQHILREAPWNASDAHTQRQRHEFLHQVLVLSKLFPEQIFPPLKAHASQLAELVNTNERAARLHGALQSS